MFEIQVIDELDSGHVLELPYSSKCNGLHGHRWKVMVRIQGPLDSHGMVVDFTRVKQVLRGYDHRFFVSGSAVIAGKPLEGLDRFPGVIVVPFEPTAENLAQHLAEQVQNCLYRVGRDNPGPLAQVMSVELWETPSGCVRYTVPKPE